MMFIPAMISFSFFARLCTNLRIVFSALKDNDRQSFKENSFEATNMLRIDYSSEKVC